MSSNIQKAAERIQNNRSDSQMIKGNRWKTLSVPQSVLRSDQQFFTEGHKNVYSTEQKGQYVHQHMMRRLSLKWSYRKLNYKKCNNTRGKALALNYKSAVSLITKGDYLRKFNNYIRPQNKISMVKIQEIFTIRVKYGHLETYHTQVQRPITLWLLNHADLCLITTWNVKFNVSLTKLPVCLL
jgi:hypothetical protein